ncbi:hypothetical protein M8C21_017799, partial [Ambrosia artemisiifolia]
MLPSYKTRVCPSTSFNRSPITNHRSMGLGLADPILHDHEPSHNTYLPQSTIYNRSFTRFLKPFLTPTEDTQQIQPACNDNVKVALERIKNCQSYCGCNLHNSIARWDTRFRSGVKAVLLQPFSPIVVAADDSECI